MVLYAQFAGLAPLNSSKLGVEFLSRPNLPSSSPRLPPKTLTLSPSFHFCCAIRRLSVSSAAAASEADSKYPEPSQKPSENSIFLHVLDRHPDQFPVKKPLTPTANPENPTSCNGHNVGVPNGSEGSIQEENRAAAVECDGLGDGGGKQEEAQGFSTEQLEASGRQIAAERSEGTAVQYSELGDGGGKDEERQDVLRKHLASSRRRIAEGRSEETALQCSELGDVGQEKEENFSPEQFAVNEAPEADSNVYENADTGLKKSSQRAELEFKNVEEEEKQLEAAIDSQGFGRHGSRVNEQYVLPSQMKVDLSEVWEYEFGDTERELNKVAEELSANFRGNGSSELASLGEQEDFDPSDVTLSPTSSNLDAVDVQADPNFGRRQGLKVGRRVYLTGDDHYKRWMPKSEAKHHLQGDLEESSGQEEEEILDPISETGESAVSPSAGDGDDEKSGDDKEVDLQEEEDSQTSSDVVDASGGETDKDLLVEFLKKRIAHWGDGTRAFTKDSSVILNSHVPEQKNDTSSAGERCLFTSAEVMTSLDQLSLKPSSAMGDRQSPPTGLIYEIVSIAKNLPPNASLETFLTPLCGQISPSNGNLVLRALGENQLTWPMLSFFQWMRLHDPCLLNSRTFCTLFTCLGKLKMAEQALLQFENMPEDEAFHCVQVYNSLLGALSRAGRPEKIPVMLQEMEKRNVERDTVTYSILITATKGKERYSKVWRLFDDLLSEGVKPDVFVYGSLIKAFCDEGHLNQALLVSLSMEKKGFLPNVIIYNTLIDAHARASLLGEAEGLLVEMKQRGVHPIESTYNALINGYGMSGQLDVAEELVLEMQKEDLKPNVATYTSLISCYGKHLLSERAVNAFLRMRKSGLNPNTQTYTALINAYAEGGWHEKAQRAFDNMLREGLKPTIETYTALLDGYRRAGDLDMVRLIWNTIKEDGCEVTKVTYCTIMDAFAKHGFYVEARDVMDEFRKRGLEPDTIIFNMLLNAYARGSVCTKLQKVMTEMQAAGCEPDCFTYCTLIYTYIRHRDFTNAFKYEKEMQEKGLLPSPRIYGKMKFILDAKYSEKLENDRKADAGQGPNGLLNGKRKNPQRAKRNFKRYQKKRPRRGTELTKALWKDKENQGVRQGSSKP